MHPVVPRYVADLFAPLNRELVSLLRGLTAEQWELQTVARAWRVRDVAAHLLDTQLRKLSGHRDGHALGSTKTDSYEAVVQLINDLNAGGVAFAQRLSTRVITDLLAITGASVAEFVE